MRVFIDGKPVKARQVIVEYDIGEQVVDATHLRITLTPKRIKEVAWDVRKQKPEQGVKLEGSPDSLVGFGFENNSRTPPDVACDIT